MWVKPLKYKLAKDVIIKVNSPCSYFELKLPGLLGTILKGAECNNQVDLS